MHHLQAVIGSTGVKSNKIKHRYGATQHNRNNQSINHFIVLKKDMHCTTHDLQYVGWSQQNASEFQMYPL